MSVDIECSKCNASLSISTASRRSCVVLVDYCDRCYVAKRELEDLEANFENFKSEASSESNDKSYLIEQKELEKEEIQKQLDFEIRRNCLSESIILSLKKDIEDLKDSISVYRCELPKLQDL